MIPLDEIRGASGPAEWSLETFIPEEVLYIYDIPLIFTLKDTTGHGALAYFFDEDPEKPPIFRSRFLVVQCEAHILEKMIAGHLPVRSVLCQSYDPAKAELPTGWVVEISNLSYSVQGKESRIHSVVVDVKSLLDQFPDYFPDPCITLY